MINVNELLNRIENNYLFGCIKYKGEYNVYIMPIAWWILNFEAYDPDITMDQSTPAFRNHIYNVKDAMIDKFIDSIEIDKIDINILEHAWTSIALDDRKMQFFIDFDLKIYISAFVEVEAEEYLPDENWVGQIGTPWDFLPDRFKFFFV